MPLEELKHACGVSAIYAPGADFASMFFTAHTWMQPRGQESAGVALTDGEKFRFLGGQGSVVDIFNEGFFSELEGHHFIAGIGQNRYSTTGSNSNKNVQPIYVCGPAGEIELGHNGDITNNTELLPLLDQWDVQMVSTMDSELVAHMIVHAPGRTWEERIAWTMERLRGSYCLAILTKEAIYLARDPMENRPFLLGEVPGGYMAASELIAIEEVDGSLIREINGGEIVRLDGNGITSFRGRERYDHCNTCPFEWIYFSAPENILRGKVAKDVRQRAGRIAARRFRTKGHEVDLVFGVPDSGLEAAKGVANELGEPLFDDGIRKNPSIKRTFLHPNQKMRQKASSTKYRGNRVALTGKRLAVVDDSSVRWNTITSLIKALKRAGVVEIHFIFSWWPVRRPCHFGIDMYTLEELPASAFDTVEEVENHMAQRFGDGIVVSFTFITPKDIAEASQEPLEELCTGCYDGEYKEEIFDKAGKGVLEKVQVSGS